MLKFTSIALLLFAIHSINGSPVSDQQEELPVFECVSNFIDYECVFNDLKTTKANPRFQPYSRFRGSISNVIISGDSTMEVLTRDICDYFPSLGVLQIRSKANLLEIAEDALENCAQLGMFDIDGNELTTLPANLFKNNPKLWSIDIRRGPLTTIDPNAFSQNELRSINLRGTQLEEIPFESMGAHTGYMNFYVYSNNLKDFPIEMLLAKYRWVGAIGINDNDIPCARVQQILDAVRANPNAYISTDTYNKPREGEVSSVGGITCIP